MIRTLITSAALLATSVVAQDVGRAIIVNSCNFPVGLTNVPSAGGGQNQVGPETLNTGSSYSQPYIALTNGNGWSAKLTTPGGSGILQFEYTYQNDGVIWFDLSAVNGDPFNNNWSLSATGSCDPKNTAYLYPTDDANGMQSSCPASSSVTVTLCSDGASTPADPNSPSAAPSGASPSAGSPVASTPTTSPTASGAAPVHDGPHDQQQTQSSPGFQQLNAATVTNVKTTVVTHYVTVSPSPVQNHRREEHLHRHMNRHNH